MERTRELLKPYRVRVEYAHGLKTSDRKLAFGDGVVYLNRERVNDIEPFTAAIELASEVGNDMAARYLSERFSEEVLE